LFEIRRKTPKFLSIFLLLYITLNVMGWILIGRAPWWFINYYAHGYKG